MRMIMNEGDDFLATGLTVTLERSEVIDFLAPMIYGVKTLIAKRPTGTSFNFWAYIDVFSVESWTGLAIILLTISLASYTVNLCQIDTLHRKTDSEQFGLLNAFALHFTMSLIFYMHITFPPSTHLPKFSHPAAMHSILSFSSSLLL